MQRTDFKTVNLKIQKRHIDTLENSDKYENVLLPAPILSGTLQKYMHIFNITFNFSP